MDSNKQLGLAGPLNIKSDPMDTSQSEMDLSKSSTLNVTVGSMSIDLHSTSEEDQDDDDELEVENFIRQDNQTYQCKFCPEVFRLLPEIRKHVKLQHPKNFKCVHCKRRFPSGLLRDRHANFHNLNHPFKCTECDQMYRSKKRLEKHFQAFHDRNSNKFSMERFHCGSCELAFVERKYHDLHSRIYHDRKPQRLKNLSDKIQVCERCVQTFDSRDLLVEHIRQTHQGDPPMKNWICKTCSKDLKTVKMLRRHILVFHFGIMPFVCQHCRVEFTTRHWLLKHIEKDHPEVALFKCLSCNKSFTTELGLTEHKDKVHVLQEIEYDSQTEKPFYQCLKCEKKLESSVHLEKHLMKAHPSFMLVYKCPLCPQSVRFRKQHMRILHDVEYDAKEHHYLVRYKCHCCLKLFEQRRKLLEHQNALSKQCGRCQMRFKTEKSLQAHMAIHQANKSLKCENCGLNFAYRGRLEEHRKRYHSPTSTQVLKIINCPYCPMLFTSPNNRARHIAANHEQRELKANCAHCPVKLLDTVLLRKHYKMVHPEERVTFKCPGCEKFYLNLSSFKDHYKKHMKEARADKKAEMNVSSEPNEDGMKESGQTNDQTADGELNSTRKEEIKQEPLVNGELASSTVLNEKEKSTAAEGTSDRKSVMMEKQNADLVEAMKGFQESTRESVAAEQPEPSVEQKVISKESDAVEKPVFSLIGERKQEEHMEVDETMDQFAVQTPAHRSNKPLKHRKRHESPSSTQLKIINCPYCPQLFTRPRNQARHIAVKHGQSEFKVNCVHCPVQVTDTVLLRKHYRTVHPGERAMFKCPRCEKVYLDRSSFKGHYYTHRKEAGADEKTSVPSTSGPVEDGVKENDQNADGELESNVIKEEAIVQIENPAAHGVNTAERPAGPSRAIEYEADQNADQESEDDTFFRLDNQTYQCKFCPEIFHLLQEIRKHIKVHHPSEWKYYRCEYCKRYFPSGPMRDRHVDFHSLKHPFKCAECDQMYRSKKKLEKHFEVFHDKNSDNFSMEWFHCGSCELTFAEKKYCDLHSRIYHEREPPRLKNLSDKIQVCERCVKTFDSRDLQLEHNRQSHQGDPPMKNCICKTCSKDLKTVILLKIHILVAHFGIKPFVCQHCNAEFSTRRLLLKHLEKDHPEAALFKCPSCDESFSTKSRLEEHQDKVHVQLEIEYDPQTGKTKKSFQTHMAIHRGNKSLKCEDCGLDFGGRGRLVRHRRRYHSPTSTEVLKIINCPYCPQLFVNPSNRKRHIATKHVQSEFKVICGHCPVQVADSVLLRKHYKTVHPEERVTYKCPECEKLYLNLIRFKDHYKKHWKVAGADNKTEMNSTSGPFYDGVEESSQTNDQNADGELVSIVIKEEAIVQIENAAAPGLSATTGIKDKSLNFNDFSEQVVKTEIKQEPLDDCLS